MDYGTLRVATPDGQIREYPITTPQVVIGRADGNQVVIDHVSVSRRHAQLVIESGRVTIEDLGSGTGTFLGSQRLQGNTPSLVESGQTMRFGDVEARFVFAEALNPSTPGGATSGAAETEQTIGVALTSPSAAISAGSPTTATVLVQNRGSVVDEVTIAIVDLPAGWAKVSRPTVNLVPGARDEVTVVIQPPKDSTAAAGDYEFSVAVTSKVHGREVRALGKLSVRAFEGFRVGIDPARGKRDFKIITTNNGNVPITIALNGTDEAKELTYAFEAETFELQPGEERRTNVAVAPQSRKLFGPAVNRPFRVEARQAGASVAPTTAEGSLMIKPPLQAYRFPALIFIVLAILSGGIFGYSSACKSNGWPGCGSDNSPAAVDSTPTTGAVASPGVTAAATATPTGLFKGGNAVITNSDPNPPTNSNCLAVRSGATPRIAADNILGRLCTGTRVAVKDGPTNDGVYVWWQIEGNGLTGWAAEKRVDSSEIFIQPAP